MRKIEWLPSESTESDSTTVERGLRIADLRAEWGVDAEKWAK
jgi:hypothetical protein